MTATPVSSRFEVLRGVVHPWHEDHFGHMNVRFYAAFFSDATYHLMTRLGIPYSQMLARYGMHCVTAQSTTRYLKELKAGDLIVIFGTVARVGNKSATYHMEMTHADTGEVHARYELLHVFFDPEARKSTPMPPEIRAMLEKAFQPEV